MCKVAVECFSQQGQQGQRLCSRTMFRYFTDGKEAVWLEQE